MKNLLYGLQTRELSAKVLGLFRSTDTSPRWPDGFGKVRFLFSSSERLRFRKIRFEIGWVSADSLKSLSDFLFFYLERQLRDGCIPHADSVGKRTSEIFFNS